MEWKERGEEGMIWEKQGCCGADVDRPRRSSGPGWSLLPELLITYMTLSAHHVRRYQGTGFSQRAVTVGVLIWTVRLV